MGYAIRPQDDLIFTLPPKLEDWLGDDHPARFIRDIVSELDVQALGFEVREYNEGRSPYSAELLLRVWLYGFFERYRSTRKLEWACRNVIPLIWLTGNQPPDHNTIWRFFNKHKKALRKLFKASVQIAARAGMVGQVLHAIDGTKVQAACSTDTALHKRQLTKALSRLDEELDRMMEGVHNDPAPVASDAALPSSMKDMQERKAAIREALTVLEQAETEHLHPGDPDARMMKARGQNMALSYNAQAAVDAESGLIVAADVVSDANDQRCMNTMLDAVGDTVGAVAESTIFDAGYLHGAEIEQALERNANVVVNGLEPSERSDDAFAKSNFVYDAERDVYVCPRGELLPLSRLTHKGKKAAHETAVYQCMNMHCVERHLCTKSKKGRTIDRTPYDDSIEAQRAKQKADPESKALIAKRKEIVEIIFAIMKWNQGFRRFTVRGIENVQAQWALMCATLNFRKLYRLWVDNGLTLAPAA